MEKNKAYFSIILIAFMIVAALMLMLVIWDVVDFASAKDQMLKITYTFLVLAALSAIVMLVARNKAK